MKKNLIRGAATVSLVVAGIAAAIIAPSRAYAAGLPTVTMPDVAITSMNTVTIKPVKIANVDAGSETYYDWDVKTSPNVSSYSLDDLGDVVWYGGHLALSPQWTPGINPLGTYHAYQGSEAEASEATAAFSVRLGSHLTIGVTRSGKYVTISSHITYYDDNLDGYYQRGGWVNWRHPVTVQVQSGAKWVNVKTVTPGTNGIVSVRVPSPSARVWRVTDPNTSDIWGNSSSAVRK